MKDKFYIYFYAIKYIFQGDNWKDALEYSMALVKGFKKNKGEFKNEN